MQAVRLLPHLFLVNSLTPEGSPLPTCYSYALDAPAGFVFIDCGSHRAWPLFLEGWKRLQIEDRPWIAAFLTHYHGDHSLAGPAFQARGARLYAHPYTAEVLATQIERAFGPIGTDEVGPFSVDVRVQDGERVAVAGQELEMVYTPGHTLGCLSLLTTVDGRRCLFTGDLILDRGRLGFCGSHGFSAQSVLASLQKCARRDFDLLLGGHHCATRGARACIERGIARGEKDLWASQIAGPRTKRR